MYEHFYNSVKASLRSILACTICLVGLLSADNAQAQIANNTPGAISGLSSFFHEASLLGALESGAVADLKLRHKSALVTFYQERQNQAYWMSEKTIYSRAEDMYKAIDEAWTHGLNPHNYHYIEIYRLMGEEDAQSRAELELLLTDAFIAYARDLSGMRVDGRPMNLDNENWKPQINALEALQYLNSGSGDFKSNLHAIEPQGQTYKALRRELIRLVNEGESEKEDLLPIFFEGVLRPGWGHAVVPKIRAYLEMPKLEHNNTTYDDNLAAAVIHFQKENNLEPDGVIGSSTLEAINRTNLRKINQIIANLERLRWVNTDRGDKFVIVNIPSATLWAIENGKVAFEMPVIVGTPVRATLSFNTVINGVRLNPDWTVPPTIKKFDILPKVKEDPAYFADKGMELIRGYGSDAKTLDPYSIDWDNLSTSELHSIRMVQTPGDHNPLGRYRVLMPNRHNIYLHDTNHPELFSKNERALSSGCIRMKYPRQMTEFLLEDAAGKWDDERIDSVLETYHKTDIDLQRSIPVSILYYTAWLDGNGHVVYGNDIYNKDEKLFEMLSNIDGIFIPVHNKRYAGDLSDAQVALNR